MDTTIVTLIPALLAPPAAASPGFPVHGRVTMCTSTAALLARSVLTHKSSRAA